MELRAASVLLIVLCVIVVITTTEGHVPNCCVDTKEKIPRTQLKKATKYEMQSDTGSCDHKALVLHVGSKKYCFNPKTEKIVKKWLMKPKHGKRQGGRKKQ